MSEARKRNTSLEIIQSKADSIRALDLDDVDADLSSLNPDGVWEDSDVVERTPEDDEVIASVIREVEQEILKEDTKVRWDVLNLAAVLLAVGCAIWYLQSNVSK